MSKLVKQTENELKIIIENAVNKAMASGDLPQAEIPQFNIESRLIKITAIIQQMLQWQVRVHLKKHRK